MESYARLLQSLYGEILTDVVAQYPDYRCGAERDRSRLLSMVEHRGISVFTLDLPALGKALDHALASGSLIRTGLPLSRTTRRTDMIPRLFSGLYRRIFDQSGCLLDQPDPHAVLFLRTLLYAGKKWKMECAFSKTVKAVKEFYQVDRDVDAPTLEWDSVDFDPRHARDLSLNDGSRIVERLPLMQYGGYDEDRYDPECHRDHLSGIQLVADITSTELGEFSYDELSYKHGPGAVADQGRWENKYLFPTWSARLDRAFPVDAVGFANATQWIDAIQQPDVDYGLSDHDHPSVLIAVPKTQKTPRLIAKEPIANQWCQQGLLDFLARGSKRVSIGAGLDFSSQEPSRALAQSASLTGDLATIDLSSASDRVSCWLIERLFRRNFPLLDAFQAVRTSWIVNDIDKKSPRYHRLRKFSTMGSALTFPVQSYVYCMIAVGVLLVERKMPITTRTIRTAAQEVQVFGDDIIVPTDVSGAVIAALEHLGFKVNRDKTFWTGRFRESCGMDAFMGHDVTPAYITQLPQRARPESMIATVELAKNFFKKGFYNAAAWIEKTACENRLLRALPRAPVDSGLFAWPSSSYVLELPQQRKFDTRLQRMVYRTVVPKGRRNTRPTQGSTGLSRFFYEKPRPETFWTSAVAQRPKLYLKLGWEPLDSILEPTGVTA